MHLLNDAGAEIWSRMDGTRSVRSIAAELSRVFEAEPDGVTRDVHLFLERLAGLELLESSEARLPMAPERPPPAPERRSFAIDTVWVDWYTAQVVDAFRRRGIESILLKGPAIRRWLYRDDPGNRGYIDADLLVEAGKLGSAAEVLLDLGFRHEDDRGLGSIHVWATSWRRADGAVVDLHRTLQGCEHSSVDPWPVLRQSAVEEQVGGSRVLLPGAAVLAVQVVLVSPADRPWRRWDDLQRLLDQLPLDGWREAAAVAQALGVSRLFGYRLSQSPAGLALAQRIGVETAPAWWLRWEADPMLRWLVLLASLSGWRARLRLIRGLFLPPVSYVRFRDPEMGRRGVASSYAAWAAHVMRLVPGAARTLARSLMRAGRRS